MSNIGDAARSAGDVMYRLHELERAVESLAAARSLEAAAIGAGGMTFKDGGSITVEDGGTIEVLDGGGIRLRSAEGTIIFHVTSAAGLPEPDGDPQPLIRMSREDGSVALALEDPLPTVDGYRQIFRLFDRAGHEIFAEDATSGEGMATPWLPFPLVPARYTDWPKSTSGTYETIWGGYLQKQQPKAYLYAKHTSDAADTTGQMRWLINETQVGTVDSIGFVISDHLVIEPVNVGHGEIPLVELQVRRTAGAGNVMAAPYFTSGRQT